MMNNNNNNEMMRCLALLPHRRSAHLGHKAWQSRHASAPEHCNVGRQRTKKQEKDTTRTVLANADGGEGRK